MIVAVDDIKKKGETERYVTWNGINSPSVTGIEFYVCSSKLVWKHRM